MSSPLTDNCLTGIINGASPQNPVVQILTIKKLGSGDGKTNKQDRYRLTVSDGMHKHNSAMLATQLNPLIVDEKIIKNGALRLTKYMSNVVQDRTIIIILGAEVVSRDLGQAIGDPVAFGEKKKTAQVPARTPTHTPSTETSHQPAASSFIPNRKPQLQGTNPYKSPTKPSTGDSGIGSGSAETGAFSPIMSLHPYLHRWAIRARVSNKSKVREWNNQRGSGRLFSVDLIDNSGEIRATGFNEVCDRLHPIFEIGKCYIIRGAKIKPANKRFNSLNNEYEMQFESDTTATLDNSAEDKVPQQKFHFKTFEELGNTPVSREMNVFVDVLAICHEVKDADTIMTKTTNKELTKRDVILMDQSARTLTCALWGKDAEEFEANGGVPGCVLAIKSARLSDFNGRSLSVSQTSTIYINPQIDEAQTLKGCQIKDDQIGMEEGKAEYFITVGTITYIKKENCMYKACPSDTCNKKVVDQGPSDYRCEKCNKSYPNFKWRLMTSMSIADATGQTWVTAFQESAERLLHCTSDELGTLQETDEALFSKKIADAQFQAWKLKCRAKADTYQDDTRVRVSVVSVEPLNFVEEARYLISQIRLYGA
eukprot:gene1107-4335_t